MMPENFKSGAQFFGDIVIRYSKMVIHKWDYFPAPSYTLLSICQKNGREDLKLCVSRFQKVCSMANDTHRNILRGNQTNFLDMAL